MPFHDLAMISFDLVFPSHVTVINESRLFLDLFPNNRVTSGSAQSSRIATGRATGQGHGRVTAGSRQGHQLRLRLRHVRLQIAVAPVFTFEPVEQQISSAGSAGLHDIAVVLGRVGPGTWTRTTWTLGGGDVSVGTAAWHVLEPR